MSKLIKVLSIEIANPEDRTKKYTIMTVNYTDAGKLASRKILSFVAKDVYAAFSKAVSGESFEVTEEKNAKGYYEFLTAKSVGVVQEAAGSSSPPAARSSSVAPSGGSTYSTKDERDQTQIYIVRQSSIKHAIDTISLLGGKTAPTQEAILKLASKYEDFVFGKSPAVSKDSVGASEAAAKKANAALDDDLSDIPF